ncbi:MAG TPA: 4-hydroxybenzoate octaprenyltransferase [Micavibrio sp.]|nr:4-hydroxybenzoate octaprenyltransferase [Micavibrio sp.]HIL29346.1 4-hydroxybenzoate octaprenyltransferase [Micavibrio sp.]
MTHDKAQNFTDIKKNAGWLKMLPAFLQPYALLMRLDRPIGSWLLLLPGLWSIALASGGITGFTPEIAMIFVLFCIGAIIMRGAGCVINDLWDRNLDKMVERTAQRPLAAGTISPKQALAFLGFLLLLGLMILLQLNFMAILLGVLTIPLIASYPLMKRITWWPQLFLGITFNFGALIGWASINETVSLSALTLYIAGIFWTLGYDTIYAHQDMEDDIKVGIKSAALKLGQNSRKGIACFYAVAFALIAIAFTMAHAGALSLIALAAAGYHLWHQIKNWQPESQESSLATFKSNRNFGLLVLCAALI